MRRFAAAILAAFALALPATAADVPFAKDRAEWMRPMAPFHILDHLYYVGTEGIAVFLIVTPRGDILTDGGLPEMAPVIRDHIRRLGVKLPDIKILLSSHAHYDHAGGLAALKKATGAKLYAGAADAEFLARGRISYGPSAGVAFAPVTVDRKIRDGDTVSLGGVTLIAVATPGHTPGCTSWRGRIDGKDVLFSCSVTVAGSDLIANRQYPNIATDFKQTFARLHALKADVLLAPHGFQFNLDTKRARMKAGAPNPFVDAGDLARYVATAERDYDHELARQEALRR